ncbi:MAG: APC family permease [Sulfurifustaceae bacterium]
MSYIKQGITSKGADISTRLIRGIDRWSLLALVINGVIGAGIFGLPAKLYALAGSYSLLAFVACAVFVALLVLCFAEVASRFADTGGPYLYARSAFGPLAGFQIGWLMWLTRLTGFAALCNLLVGYLGYFFPATGSGVWRTVVITFITGAYAYVNIVGIRPSALVSNAFTIGKLIPLTLFVAAGLFFIEPGRYSIAGMPSYDDFSTAVLLLVFAFSGFEVALIPAGEVRDPRRHVPFALLTAIAIVALLYVLIQLVCIGTLPSLAQSDRPLADAGELFLGAAGAAIITLGAVISIIGTLNTGMIAAPRLLFAMAEHGQLPSTFAATHARFRTPYVSILATAGVMLVLTLQATFISALKISTIIRLITYGATCLALIRLRGDSVADFVAPGGRAAALAAAVLCVVLLFNSTLEEAILVAAAALLGSLLYLAYRVTGERAIRQKR